MFFPLRYASMKHRTVYVPPPAQFRGVVNKGGGRGSRRDTHGAPGAGFRGG